MLSKLIWCGPLPDHSAAAVEAYLQQFGPIRRFRCIDGAIPPYAIAYYQTFESGAKALENREPIITVGEVQARIKVNIANPLSDRQCVIGNVDYGTTESEVLALVEQFGPVDQVRTPHGSAGCGMAFVAYQEVKSVAACMRELKGVVFHGRPLSVREYAQTPKPTESQRWVSNTAPVSRGGILYTSESPESEPIPKIPQRLHDAPEPPFTRRKGSRRRCPRT